MCKRFFFQFLIRIFCLLWLLLNFEILVPIMISCLKLNRKYFIYEHYSRDLFTIFGMKNEFIIFTRRKKRMVCFDEGKFCLWTEAGIINLCCFILFRFSYFDGFILFQPFTGANISKMFVTLNLFPFHLIFKFLFFFFLS